MTTLREQIEACRGLSRNLDSYGGHLITDATVDFALEVAEQLPGVITMACPCSDGSIELSDGDVSKWIKITVD